MRGRGRFAVLLLTASSVIAQSAAETGLSPDVLLLAKVKLKMAENLDRLPNYTCLETIERSERRAPSRRVRVIDTVQLEVALVDGHEMFSWPGAERFEKTKLRDIVPTGAIGNGSFGLHARAIFLGSFPLIKHAGEEEIDGRRYARFDYKVSLISSGYNLKVESAEAIVPYYGSFWVNPESLDVFRRTVIADDIPPHLPLQSAGQTMEYARVDIGGRDFLLPRRAVLTMVDLTGNESRNETTFSSCRQYVGESFLSFAEPPPVEERLPPAPPEEVDLPSGLRLVLALETPIDSRSSLVGDPVTAMVRSNARRKKQVIVPKGATVRGRLLHLQKIDGRVPYFTVAIQFEEIEFANKRADLVAELDSFVSVFAAGRPSLHPNFPGATLIDQEPLADVPGVGIFYIRGTTFKVSKGTRMVWRTVTAPASN